MSEAAEEGPEARASGQSEREMERLLLSSAAAIQRLIAERNALRAQVEAQARELQQLKRHVALFHDSYRRLTSEFVDQFQLIDDALSGISGETMQENEAPRTEPDFGSNR
jgi:predicted RNase H-like nuclease (RuvC/YqgF family)